MDVDGLKKSIRQVIKSHAAAFKAIGVSQPKLLELSAVTGVAQHYQSIGYAISVINPTGKKSFTIKASTRGYPWNFSRIVAVSPELAIEIHMNLMVRGAHDDGIYCVDVGVVEANSVPSEAPPKEQGKWVCLENGSLITFAEAKKLVVYPMLLAQFVGIVHEIKPIYLTKDPSNGHLPPTLIALGHFSGNSQAIVSAYAGRSIHLRIAENYDVRLAKVRGGHEETPFH